MTDSFFLRRPYDDPLSEDGSWGLLYDVNGTIVDPTQAAGSGGEGNPLGGLANGGGGLGGRLGQNGQNQQNQQGQNRGGIGQGNTGGLSGIGQQGQQPGNVPNLESDLPKTGKFSDPDEIQSLSESNAQNAGGGLPIAGIKTTSEDLPFRIWNDLEEYSEWQFTFRWVEQEMQRQALAGAGGINNGPGGPGGAGGRNGGQQLNNGGGLGNRGNNRQGGLGGNRQGGLGGNR